MKTDLEQSLSIIKHQDKSIEELTEALNLLYMHSVDQDQEIHKARGGQPKRQHHSQRLAIEIIQKTK